MPIEKAIDFVILNVDDPAITNSFLEKEFKNKAQSTKNLVKNFKKVGDLYCYLSRFNKKPLPGENHIYDRFKSLGLKTYEDIYPEFQEKFKNELDDITVIDDFVIGEYYTSWDIAIFAKSYNCQNGIYLIGDEPNYKAIFLKCTFGDGDYANEWIEKNQLLKYYLYGQTNQQTGKKVYNVDHKYNRVLINSSINNIPIYIFMRNSKNDAFKLNGIFEYVKLHREADNSMWSELSKINSLEVNKKITSDEYDLELDKEVKKSRSLPKEERRKRLAEANKIPEKIQASECTTFKRNPDVIAEVLENANGYCGYCKNYAPFIRRSDNTPYLEVHHIVHLAKGGEDSVENAVALCPNCHRKAHFE